MLASSSLLRFGGRRVTGLAVLCRNASACDDCLLVAERVMSPQQATTIHYPTITSPCDVEVLVFRG